MYLINYVSAKTLTTGWMCKYFFTENFIFYQLYEYKFSLLGAFLSGRFCPRNLCSGGGGGGGGGGGLCPMEFCSVPTVNSLNYHGIIFGDLMEIIMFVDI